MFNKQVDLHFYGGRVRNIRKLIRKLPSIPKIEWTKKWHTNRHGHRLFQIGLLTMPDGSTIKVHAVPVTKGFHGVKKSKYDLKKVRREKGVGRPPKK